MTLDRAEAPPFAPRLRLMMCLAALAAAFTVSPSPPAHADRVTPPPVPHDIQVPTGNKAFRKGDAIGTQGYICLLSASGFTWTFFGPQATLFNEHDEQIITHFLSPNPVETGTPPLATWQDSEDTSKVWGRLARPDALVTPDPTAIPWLLLQAVGAQDGPTGGDELSGTTYIQRLNTVGGLAPTTGCTASTDVGTRSLVAYTAEYFFYKAKHK